MSCKVSDDTCFARLCYQGLRTFSGEKKRQGHIVAEGKGYLCVECLCVPATMNSVYAFYLDQCSQLSVT